MKKGKLITLIVIVCSIVTAAGLFTYFKIFKYTPEEHIGSQSTAISGNKIQKQKIGISILKKRTEVTIGNALDVNDIRHPKKSLFDK